METSFRLTKACRSSCAAAGPRKTNPFVTDLTKGLVSRDLHQAFLDPPDALPTCRSSSGKARGTLDPFGGPKRTEYDGTHRKVARSPRSI
jgi:hypothetical protein